MPARINYSSGAPWEATVGYSRAVRVGTRVLVSGTTATLPDGSIDGPGNPAIQARRCLQNIERALAECNAQLSDVVRTRIYLLDIDDWQQVGAVHGEFFRHIRPAATLVQVARLIDPAMLVEIEAEAVVDPDPGS